MYLEAVPKYRDTIMETICKCDAVIDLLRPADQPEIKASEMPYKFIFPYSRIIDKTTEAGIYICFDVFAPRVIDRTFTDFRIDFWIIAHERCMRTDKGLVTDLLSIEIDKLINGNRGFGLGRVELKAWDGFTPAEGFHGRSLVYRTVDFNGK